VIPNVVGQSLRSAELSLRRRGLVLGEVALLSLPGLAPDQVIAQTPAASAIGIANPKVGLLATPPPAPAEYVMPSLVGSPIAEAVRLLQKAGIKVRQAQQTPPPSQLTPASDKSGQQSATPSPATLRQTQPDTAPATPSPVSTPGTSSTTQGTVVSQTPPAGTKITSGTTVELQVR
jgi:beta-lactam-binding protein with PASTA domain